MRPTWCLPTPDPARKAAYAMAHKAIAVDETFGWSYVALGMNYLTDRQYDKAVAAGKKAVQLQPNSADAHGYLGFYLTYAGRADEAIPHLKTALRLNPRWFGPFLNFLGQANYYAGRYQDAVSAYEENATRRGPIIHTILAYWAASYVKSGQIEKAKATIQRLLKRFPMMSVRTWPQWLPPNLYRHPEDIKDFWATLRKAGFPERPKLMRPDKT